MPETRKNYAFSHCEEQQSSERHSFEAEMSNVVGFDEKDNPGDVGWELLSGQKSKAAARE